MIPAETAPPLKWIDTHCHLYFPEYDGDRGLVVERALQSGVAGMIQIGIDESSNHKAMELARSYSCMRASAGWHPHEASSFGSAESEALRRGVLGKDPLLCAVGECGLDYFKSKAAPEEQRKVFAFLCELAGEAGLPLVVHSRNAFDDSLRILLEARRRHPRLEAVFHCFTYGPEEARRASGEGFYLSFSGILTFKNAQNIREAAARVPDDRFVLETDAPYLSPGPNRGTRNEPSFMRGTAEELAKTKGVSLERIAAMSTGNAERLFGWKAGIV